MGCSISFEAVQSASRDDYARSRRSVTSALRKGRPSSAFVGLPSFCRMPGGTIVVGQVKGDVALDYSLDPAGPSENARSAGGKQMRSEQACTVAAPCRAAICARAPVGKSALIATTPS